MMPCVCEAVHHNLDSCVLDVILGRDRETVFFLNDLLQWI